MIKIKKFWFFTFLLNKVQYNINVKTRNNKKFKVVNNIFYFFIIYKYFFFVILVFTNFPGTPATNEFDGIDLTTTELATINTIIPIFIGRITFTPALELLMFLQIQFSLEELSKMTF